MAGLMKRRKKNPPISEQMEKSVASGYFLCKATIKSDGGVSIYIYN